jgi:transcriptional regulator with XRE-family HTH domain
MATTADLVLTLARRNAGLTQRSLSARARRPQARIAEIETGANDPKVATLDGYLAATGHQLVLIASRGTTVAEAALRIREYTSRGDEDNAFRVVIDLHDQLRAEATDVRVALCSLRPPASGEAKWDALLAGLVDYLLGSTSVVPAWVESEAFVLTEPWFVDPTTANRDEAERTTPLAFARRNVFLTASEFASV